MKYDSNSSDHEESKFWSLIFNHSFNVVPKKKKPGRPPAKKGPGRPSQNA